jgi:hypothetical protein
MIRQFRHSVIDARVPQEPPLGVVDEVAVAGKPNGHVPTLTPVSNAIRRATAVAAVDHIEAVYSGLDLRVLDVTFAFMNSSIRNLIEVVTAHPVLVYSLEAALGG